MSPERRLQQLDLLLDNLRAKGFTDKHPAIIIALHEVAESKESFRSFGDDGEGRSAKLGVGKWV